MYKKEIQLHIAEPTTKCWVDLSKIPTFLGETLPERLFKWMQYAEKGLYLYER